MSAPTPPPSSSPSSTPASGYDHPDLAANIWRNTARDPGQRPRRRRQRLHRRRQRHQRHHQHRGNPTDDLGHGTHVAGIIGAVGNNGIGITGVAWRVQIMALKFLRGGTPACGSARPMRIECIDYAIAHGAHIINASYGAAAGAVTQFDPAEFDAIATRPRRRHHLRRRRRQRRRRHGSARALSRELPPRKHRLGRATPPTRDDLPLGTNFGSGSVELFAPGIEIYSTLPRPRDTLRLALRHVDGRAARRRRASRC